GLSLRRAIDTPESDLLGVFGENALAERDALIEVIRQRLDTEGIELGNALQTGGLSALPEPEEERPERESRSDSPVEVAPAPREWVEPKVPPTAAKRERAERAKPATIELPSDKDGEMSAMELAFAMAGAQADLAADESSEDEAEGNAESSEG
ncbi:MAG: hypothetical protein ACR2J8_09125, partial [Thermomicrobiales bacterium]